MSDDIYKVNPSSKELVAVSAVSFANIGIRERSDLEGWVINHPAILGEPLLIITSEFSGFDKTSRRLDVLALDSEGELVVVELKLDASRSLADLQAVRYAAFCSTITSADLVTMLAESDGCSEEAAADKIRDFLKTDEIPELNGQPRIIIAAGSIDDQELTSTVLWLRSFGIDISCVELTPYIMPSDSSIILVPKTIIPVPEARDYIVRVEQKQTGQARKAGEESRYSRFWKKLADEFNRLSLDFHTWRGARGRYMQVTVGSGKVHYEWNIRSREQILEIALHFESDDPEENIRMLDLLNPHADEIRQDVDLELDMGRWGKNWAVCRFLLPFTASGLNDELVPKAAHAMQILIQRTWPLLEPYFKRG